VAKRAVAALAIAAVVFGSLAGVIAVRSWRSGLGRLHPLRTQVPSAPAIEGLQEINFKDATGLRLRGWWVPSKNRAAVVLVHGFAGDRSQLTAELAMLARHGYGVLAFDTPGHGQSEGDTVTWGRLERSALVAAIDLAASQPGVDPQRLGGLGFSMGAATLIEVAALDPRLKAIAVLGSYTSMEDVLKYDYGKWGRLTQLPARAAMESGGVQFAGPTPLDAIAKVAPRPVLIVQGDQDHDNPPELSRQLFEAAGEPKTWWLVPGAHHGDYAQIDGPGYEQKLVFLFDGALLK
jgi:uncharacterized protein